MDLSSIPPSPMKGIVNIVVEIPAGSRNKYEYCSDAGIMALDRVLHSSVRYPFDYGFIPNTLADDGAPLDAMVIMDEPTFAGCLIKLDLLEFWICMIVVHMMENFYVYLWLILDRLI